jgi:hypothetical protein
VDKNLVYNRQHYSAYRMNLDKTDVENYVKQILADWFPTESQEVVITGLAVSAHGGTLPTTAIDISSGWGYQTQDRVVVAQTLSPALTITDLPTGMDFRNDRIYLIYSSDLDPSSSTVVEFLQADGSIIQQTIYQRKMDNYVVKRAIGSLNDPGEPTLPDTALRLAKLHVTASGITSIVDERILVTYPAT